MPKRILGTAVIAAALCGCAQNSLKQESLSSNNQNFKMNIYGELLYKNDEYYLSDKLFLDSSEALIDSEDIVSFKFHIPTLRPAFNTFRFECERSLSKNGCEPYEDKEYLFQYVNFFKSGYGDTYSEREVSELEEGMTAGEAALHVVLSPVYAAGAAPIAIGAAAAVVVMSPFIAIGAALNPEKTSQRKNYVEFHHDDFEEAVKDAIADSKLGSLEKYVSAANKATSMIDEIENLSSKRESESQTKRDALRDGIRKYYNSSTPPVVSISKPSFPRFFNADQKLIKETRNIHLKTIQDYFAREDKRIIDEYRNIEKRAKEEYRNEQINEFASLTTSKSTQAFINKYENLDLAGLVLEARPKLKGLLKLEEKERIKQAKLAEERQIADAKERLRIEKLAEQRRIAQVEELKNWRKSLKIGTDTFCGPVIDINQVMVKIAVRVQLSGYSNEAWFKRNELYPPSYGCQNRNGNLSPYS